MKLPQLRRFLIALSLITVSANLSGHADSGSLLASQQLQSKSDTLMQKALVSPTGEAGEKLEDHGSHWVFLMARARTGESELHQLWADEIVVRSGELTLVVGGTMTGTHPYLNLPGEFHGSGLDGGIVREMHAGDVAYVPAGVPHWMKVPEGKQTVVLIFKEKESAK